MTSTATMSIPRSTAGPTFAMVLRECRQQARLSQLALASEAQISSRHLSFLETGRSRPSREMALHLGQVLDLSLAQRNRLLEAAGFAAVYGRRELTDPSMAPAQSVIDAYLASLERVISQQPKVIIPAHGLPTASVWLLEQVLQHRLERERQIRALHNSGKTTDQIVADLYAGLDRKLLPLAQQNVRQHLRKLGLYSEQLP